MAPAGSSALVQSASVGHKESFPEIWGNLPAHKRLTTQYCYPRRVLLPTVGPTKNRDHETDISHLMSHISAVTGP
eukprot:5134061-Prymnesium_polylepis.1